MFRHYSSMLYPFIELQIFLFSAKGMLFHIHSSLREAGYSDDKIHMVIKEDIRVDTCDVLGNNQVGI